MATRKIRGKWFADFRYQNKRYRLKSPINTKNAAQEFEHVMLSRLIKGEPIKENEADRVITLKEFSKVWFDSYVTAHNRPSEIRRKRSVFCSQPHSLLRGHGASRNYMQTRRGLQGRASEKRIQQNAQKRGIDVEHLLEDSR